jgi:hypothetical protein
MIASRLPPSRFLGSLASAIHTPSFNCFVSTARRFFFSRRWETMIFKGDPAVDFKVSRCFCLIYCREVNRSNIEELHDLVCKGLEQFVAAQMDLPEACDEVALPLLQRGVVTDIVRLYRPAIHS